MISSCTKQAQKPTATSTGISFGLRNWYYYEKSVKQQWDSTETHVIHTDSTLNSGYDTLTMFVDTTHTGPNRPMIQTSAYFSIANYSVNNQFRCTHYFANDSIYSETTIGREYYDKGSKYSFNSISYRKTL